MKGLNHEQQLQKNKNSFLATELALTNYTHDMRVDFQYAFNGNQRSFEKWKMITSILPEQKADRFKKQHWKFNLRHMKYTSQNRLFRMSKLSCPFHHVRKVKELPKASSSNVRTYQQRRQDLRLALYCLTERYISRQRWSVSFNVLCPEEFVCFCHFSL